MPLRSVLLRPWHVAATLLVAVALLLTQAHRVECAIGHQVRKTSNIRERERETGNPLHDEVLATTDPVADDGRQPAGHGLVHDEPPRFAVVRGQHEAIGRCVGPCHMRLVQEAGKGHGKPGAIRLRHGQLPQLTIPDHQ